MITRRHMTLKSSYIDTRRGYHCLAVEPKGNGALNLVQTKQEQK